MEDNILEPFQRIARPGFRGPGAEPHHADAGNRPAITTAMAVPPPRQADQRGQTGAWPTCHIGGANTLKATGPARQPKVVHQIHVWARGVPAGITNACAVPMLISSTAPSRAAATATPPTGQVDQVTWVAEGNMPSSHARPAAALVAATQVVVLKPGKTRRNSRA